MKCHFVKTTEAHKTGRQIIRCTRCGQNGLMPPSGDVRRLHAACKSFPFWWELGHWFSIFLAAAGITKHRYNWLLARLGLVKPCGCGKRQEQLNSLGAKAARWLYRLRHRGE